MTRTLEAEPGTILAESGGLKLKPTKASANVFVVDKVDKTPTAN